jgi:hypothetical protein
MPRIKATEKFFEKKNGFGDSTEYRPPMKKALHYMKSSLIQDRNLSALIRDEFIMRSEFQIE